MGCHNKSNPTAYLGVERNSQFKTYNAKVGRLILVLNEGIDIFVTLCHMAITNATAVSSMNAIGDAAVDNLGPRYLRRLLSVPDYIFACVRSSLICLKGRNRFSVTLGRQITLCY